MDVQPELASETRRRSEGKRDGWMDGRIVVKKSAEYPEKKEKSERQEEG